MVAPFQPTLSQPSAVRTPEQGGRSIDFSGVTRLLTGAANQFAKNKADKETGRQQGVVNDLEKSILDEQNDKLELINTEDDLRRNASRAGDIGGIAPDERTDDQRAFFENFQTDFFNVKQAKRQGLSDTQIKIRINRMTKAALDSAPAFRKEINKISGFDADIEKDPQTVQQEGIANILLNRYGDNASAEDFITLTKEANMASTMEIDLKTGVRNASQMNSKIAPSVTLSMRDYLFDLNNTLKGSGDALTPDQQGLFKAELGTKRAQALATLNRNITKSQAGGAIITIDQQNSMKKTVNEMYDDYGTFIDSKDLKARLEKRIDLEDILIKDATPASFRAMSKTVKDLGLNGFDELLTVLKNPDIKSLIQDSTGIPFEQFTGDLDKMIVEGFQAMMNPGLPISDELKSTMLTLTGTIVKTSPDPSPEAKTGFLNSSEAEVRVNPSNAVDALKTYDSPKISSKLVRDLPAEDKKTLTNNLQTWSALIFNETLDFYVDNSNEVLFKFDEKSNTFSVDEGLRASPERQVGGPGPFQLSTRGSRTLSSARIQVAKLNQAVKTLSNPSYINLVGDPKVLGGIVPRFFTVFNERIVAREAAKAEKEKQQANTDPVLDKVTDPTL